MGFKVRYIFLRNHGQAYRQFFPSQCPELFEIVHIFLRTDAELLAVLNEKNITIGEINIKPTHITELVNAIADKKITSAQGKEVFAKMLESGKMPSVIIKEEGMESVSDAGAIEAIVDQVIADNPKAVSDYKGGKTNVVGWLMGQVMKASKGKANPGVATKLVTEKLSKL